MIDSWVLPCVIELTSHLASPIFTNCFGSVKNLFLSIFSLSKVDIITTFTRLFKINTFQYPWHFLSKHFFFLLLGWFSAQQHMHLRCSGNLLFKILLQRPTALRLCASALFCHCTNSGHFAAKWDFCSCLGFGLRLMYI